MAIDLRQIRYLITVAECGSITGASTRLYISQPALTASLRKLEQTVGVDLLRRHPRGIELTPAGEKFIEHARTALELVEDATLKARRIGRLSGGELTIGLLPATLSRLPRALVEAFRAQYPGTHVRYRELSYVSHTADLTMGRVDVAFLWPPYRESDVTFLALDQEPRMLGVAVSHPLSDNDVVAMDDVLDCVFPGYHPASSGGWFEGWFFDPERGAPATLTPDEAATPFEMALIVQEGRAVAPAAQSFALSFPTASVRWLPLMDAPPAVLALAWHHASRNPAKDAFIAITRAFLSLDDDQLVPRARSTTSSTAASTPPASHRQAAPSRQGRSPSQ